MPAFPLGDFASINATIIGWVGEVVSDLVNLLSPYTVLAVGVGALFVVAGLLVDWARVKMGLDVLIPYNDGQVLQISREKIKAMSDEAATNILAGKIRDETFLDWDAE